MVVGGGDGHHWELEAPLLGTTLVGGGGGGEMSSSPIEQVWKQFLESKHSMKTFKNN